MRRSLDWLRLLKTEGFGVLQVVSRKEAALSGLLFYFTGKPCRNGHVCERQVSSSSCRECSKISSRERRQGDREGALAGCRERYRKNRSDRLRYAADRYQSNKQEILAKSSAHKRANADRCREYQRDYWINNRDRLGHANKNWYAANPAKKSEYHSRRRSRVAASGGSHTVSDVAEILKMQRGRCAYCRAKLAGKYHVDHIEPLAKGGSNGRDNLQALCPSCNKAKGSKDPIVFSRQRGLLL